MERKDLADNPSKLRSVMMDLRFDERDINLAWYLNEAEPDVLRAAVEGRLEDIERTSDEVSARTRLDRDRLRSFLGDIGV